MIAPQFPRNLLILLALSSLCFAEVGDDNLYAGSPPPAPLTRAQAIQALGLRTLPQPVTAPDFELAGLDGRPVSIRSLRGKLVLVNFWATWCHSCAVDRPGLKRLYARYSEQGFVVLGVSLDRSSNDTVAKFVADHGMQYPVGIDRNHQATLGYSVQGTPSNFLVSPEGLVVAGAPGPRDWDSPAARALVESLLPPASGP